MMAANHKQPSFSLKVRGVFLNVLFNTSSQSPGFLAKGCIGTKTGNPNNVLRSSKFQTRFVV